MSTFIENQNWRYATKKFDSTKKVDTKDIEILKEAIQLSASSYGLQPYKIFFIENPEVRAQLQSAAWGQTQIVDASHLIVFASINKLDENYIDSFIENIASTRSLQVSDLEGYASFMKNAILNLPEDKMATWTAKQTYIALGNLLAAAAELKIDATPMEGFEPEKFNEILGFNKRGLHATLVVPIGYRHAEDALQFAAKVRKSEEELFETI